MSFRNRADAGRQLARALADFRGPRTIVLGLPRGGVPVAAQVAEALGAPLDVIVVRKLGAPWQPELAMGAIGEDGVRVLDDDVIRAGRVGAGEFGAVEARERAELERRLERLRGGRPAVPLAGRTVVIVDDGVATGSTARAACRVARARGAERVIFAVPVGPPETVEALTADADTVVCLEQPRRFGAIGRFYGDFSPTPEDAVVSLLATHGRGHPGAPARPREPPGTVDGLSQPG